MNEIESKIQTGGLHPRDAKMKLAAEITKIFWDADLVKGAIANFRTIFQDKTRPSEMPVVRVTEDETIVDILVKCGFSKSRSSARRLIQQGGVRVDGDVIVNAVAEAPSDGTLSAKEAGRDRVLQVGKRRFARLVYE